MKAPEIDESKMSEVMERLEKSAFIMEEKSHPLSVFSNFLQFKFFAY